MGRRGALEMLVCVLLLVGQPGILWSQAPKPPSLKEQLEAQFSTDQVLVIQKDGVVGVALASSKTCPAKYHEGKLSPPDAACTAPLKSTSRPLTVGQKVNPAKIDVDLAKERISFRVVECGSCNKGSESSPYKSEIDFQFGKGYLESAGVSQIVDTISEVLAFDSGADQQPQQAEGSPAVSGQPGEVHDEVLTNSDVVKMVKVKLADGIIISKVKSSACNFDTNVDALVKLKEAGVSDAVIQAMQGAQEEARVPPEAPAESAPAGTSEAGQGQVTFSVRHRHRLMNANWQIVDYYCSGTLTISADGTVAYDCAQTEVPGGQCEHLSLPPGSIKEVKIGSGGNLHLASKKKGNFDLYGTPEDIKQAQAAIAPLIQAAQK